MKLIGSYKNGNYITLIFDDGTKIRKTDDDEFIPAFAENCDIKITDYCDMGCPMCHENSTKDGVHGDINMEFLDNLHPYTELSIGGGNALSHPQLIPFLEKLKKQKVIANITVNQMHFEKNQELIEELFKKDLVKGLGVSLVNPTDEFISLIKKYPTAVIHTINGILSKEQIEKLEDNDLKLLILGYKNFRRGTDYLTTNFDTIKEKQEFLYNYLEEMLKHFKLISFDNLALEQLQVKRLLSEKEWEEFYMGDDGTMTFYIDLVKQEFALNSTSTERYPIMSNIDDMFNKIKERNVL